MEKQTNEFDLMIAIVEKFPYPGDNIVKIVQVYRTLVAEVKTSKEVPAKSKTIGS